MKAEASLRERLEKVTTEFHETVESNKKIAKLKAAEFEKTQDNLNKVETALASLKVNYE